MSIFHPNFSCKTIFNHIGIKIYMLSKFSRTGSIKFLYRSCQTFSFYTGRCRARADFYLLYRTGLWLNFNFYTGQVRKKFYWSSRARSCKLRSAQTSRTNYENCLILYLLIRVLRYIPCEWLKFHQIYTILRKMSSGIQKLQKYEHWLPCIYQIYWITARIFLFYFFTEVDFTHCL